MYTSPVLTPIIEYIVLIVQVPYARFLDRLLDEGRVTQDELDELTASVSSALDDVRSALKGPLTKLFGFLPVKTLAEPYPASDRLIQL